METYPLARFSSVLFLTALVCFSTFTSGVFADDLPAGTAKGNFTPEGKPAVTLANAVAFVDVKEEEKPVLLILSDKKLAAEKWTNEFDLMMAHPKFSGVIFFIDKEGKVFRTDVYDDGRQASVSGYFDFKLEGAMGKDLKGTAKTRETSGAGPKIDAVFHALAK